MADRERSPHGGEITALSAWREQAEGQVFSLPGGNVVRLRRVHVLDLVKQGKIPDTLTGLVGQMIDTRQVTLQVTVEDLADYVDVVNLVAIAAFVEPQLAAEPGADVLGVEEVAFVDRAAVFEWCHVETRRLEPFRARPGRAVDAAQHGGGVRDAPEPDRARGG
jgi:hypothetical protein